MAAHRRAVVAGIVAEVRAELGAAMFAAAWEVGRAWPLDRATSEAKDLAEALARQPC